MTRKKAGPLYQLMGLEASKIPYIVDMGDFAV